MQPVEVPDIGDFDEVPVIEILVSPGDQVAVEDPLVTLESDKATMDVPAPIAGTIKAVHVKLGDKVGKGSPLLDLEIEGGEAAADARGAGERRHRRDRGGRCHRGAGGGGRVPPAASRARRISGACRFSGTGRFSGANADQRPRSGVCQPRGPPAGAGARR